MKGKKPVDVIPSPYETLFLNFDSFNAMQTNLLDDLLNSDKSIVLSAPTGSGKTVAFELAIIRMFYQMDIMQSTSNNQQVQPKAIYIAPIKALCNEIFENWRDRFKKIGINVSKLTGDTQSANLMMIRQSQIVISTPEKWDSLTRRWRDFEELLSSVQLFIVDEVHLLNEDTRGPILEVIVSRMKSSGVKRFIVASATIPNIKDLTTWLSSCNVTVAQYVFNDMQRPVPLVKHVLGVKTKLKGFQFDMKLNYQLPDIIHKFAENKAVLIFCSCRKSSEMAAFSLNKLNPIFELNNHQKTNLRHLSEQLNEPKLRKLAAKGIAYHHAGLQYADRKLIESSFREGHLMILLSTSTLAMGINLPAHLVIIKSTETYMRGGYVEYPENMLFQMIGRAGRPPYDTKGVAVLLTQHEKMEKYKKLISGKAPIESHLHKNLIEHLNSEIALGSISNIDMAMDWIRSTYLYVRSVCNPDHYGFSDMPQSLIEHKLEELVLKQINELQQANLVKISNVTRLSMEATEIGKLMAKYYLCFDTVKLFGSLQGNSSLQDIFDLIVKCQELKEFTLRVNEKNILNSLNKEPIRFPLKGRIRSVEQKISCLMQAVLGNIDIKAPGLVQESLKMFRIAERVSKCLLEFVRLCVQKSFYGKSDNQWYKTLLSSFIATKCIRVKLWENTEYASKQLQGIGQVYSALLRKAGRTTLKSIAETDASTIEHILKKAPPFGDEVLKNLILFPEYEIKILRKSTDYVHVYARQSKKCYTHKPGCIGVLIVGDSFNNLLLFTENVDSFSMEYGQFERTIRIVDSEKVEYIYAHIVHTSYVGVDVHATLEINASKIENSTKSTKKPKKQTKLKTICTETINDSDFLPEKSLDEEDTEIKIDGISTTVEKLKEFHFKKSKLCHIDQDVSKRQNPEGDSNESLLKVATIKPLNESIYMNKTKDLSTTNTSCMVQRKLTYFFAHRKKSTFESTKPLNVEFKKEEEMERISIASNKENTEIRNASEINKQNTYNNLENDYADAFYEAVKFPTEPKANFKVATKNCEKFSQGKRKSTFNNFTYPFFQIPSKKQRQKYKPELDTALKFCPLSLESFLGIAGEVEQQSKIPTLFDEKNVPAEIKRQQSSTASLQDTIHTISISKLSQQIFGKPFNCTSMQHKNQKKNKQNFASPLDLTNNFIEHKHNIIDAINIQTSPKTCTSNTSLDKLNPSEAELQFWYKVALKFQRLPTQALSLKNFRFVFNKMKIKDIEKIQMQNKLEKKNEQRSIISRSLGHGQAKSEELNENYQKKPKLNKNFFSMESSSSSSSLNRFRLKLFDDGENPTKNFIKRSTIKLINQSVMRLVMAMKFAENEFIDNMNVDEDLEMALGDLEKQNSFLFTQASNAQNFDKK